jgi:hypothetical protein
LKRSKKWWFDGEESKERREAPSTRWWFDGEQSKDGASHPPRTGRPDLQSWPSHWITCSEPRMSDPVYVLLCAPRSWPSHRITWSEPRMSDLVYALLCAPPSQHLCPQVWDDVGHRYEALKALVWFRWIDETLATNLCALSVCEIGW